MARLWVRQLGEWRERVRGAQPAAQTSVDRVRVRLIYVEGSVTKLANKYLDEPSFN